MSGRGKSGNGRSVGSASRCGNCSGCINRVMARLKLSPTVGETLQLFALVRAAGFPDPQPEYRFHPSRKWRLDWAWPEYKVALEKHGATWQQGRHTRGAGFAKDREKMNEAQLMGWIVIEATTDMIRSGLAADQLLRALEARRG